MHYAILNGDPISGVTIMQMAEGLDTGDMISSAAVDIKGKTLPEVSGLLSELGAELLVSTLDEIEAGRAVYTPQDDALSSYCPMIRKSDGLTEFDEDAEVLERKIRAFMEWPTLHSYLDGQLVKFYAADVVPDTDFDAAPGTVTLVNDKYFIVKCLNNSLKIRELQLQGKKRMAAADFLRGYRLSAGATFSGAL